MKKMNKKGFTIVELVIVIAVIAILAAVMIPTFGGIIEKANASKALQNAQNAYKNALIEVMADGVINETTYTTTDGAYTFTFTDGVLTGATEAAGAYTYTVANGTITAAAKAPAAGN
ncbi:MAG: type II secretion system protein [Ruminococcaceae bacterium]|nr:type II secretion system protein [Oscillospiraceae bacterium]